MHIKLRLITTFILLLCTSLFSYEFTAAFDDEVEQALVAFQVPGAAIAVVKDGKVIVCKGYGVIKAGENGACDEHTLFAIGSCSKAFTATSIAMLVDEHSISWDEPVVEVLPDFYLFDHYITQEVTIRDLLSHRTGLCDHDGDLLWYQSSFDRNEIMGRLKHLRKSSGFRTTFDYQNVLYLTAGQIIPEITQKSWDSFVEERIFLPLKMQESYTTLSFLQNTENVASPHYRVDEKIIPYRWYSMDNIAPATGLVSSAHDMTKWLMLQLKNNQGLVSDRALCEMQESQTIIRTDAISAFLYPGVHFLTYGLGWFLSDFQGRKMVEHGGNINGMSAQVTLLPEENLGVVVLSNLNCTSFAQAMTNTILEKFVGTSNYDWKRELLRYDAALLQYDKDCEKELLKERIVNTQPALSFTAYCGTYVNDLYGKISITFDSKTGNLKTSLFNSEGQLEHWHYDTFHYKVDPEKKDPLSSNALICFAIDEKGSVDSLTIPHLFDDEVFEKISDHK